MEQFLLDNADRYRKLVGLFKPAALNKKTDSGTEAASSDITVSARIRPILEEETSQGFPDSVFRRGPSSTVDVHELRQPVRGLPTLNATQSSNFTVDQVFGPDSTTNQIYESLVKPLVPWAWSGGVSTLFAYGQTGSGKTYTVSGLQRHVAGTLMGGAMEAERKVHICIIELAGQTAHDLLNARKQISILEDSLGTTQLAGAVEHHVTDKGALVALIDIAASLRSTASTLMNDTSSRSHAICRIRLEDPSDPEADDGLLYLVDLAGSEAARDRSAHDAARMKEAREINSSLALTKTLKHVFDPAGARALRTVVVACVNPCLADVGASKNTLRYAEMLRAVVPRARPAAFDPAVPATWNNAQLRTWIGRSSGTPPISPTLLAPQETGPQLLRLAVPEFLARCLQTAGVTAEQAQAFQTKFWKLHIDSQKKKQQQLTSNLGLKPNSSTSKPTSAGTRGEEETEGDAAPTRMERLSSSADPEPGADSIPFKQRIRPGMVVGWSRTWTVAGGAVLRAEKHLGVVLCPAAAVGPRVCDVRGKEKERYLCAMVLPGMMSGAYSVSLWRQTVVDVEQMEAEVLMEYDEATRFYYMMV
ncbi:P-loop containing nucleoside triphosphate hydrolase protein [Lasiosphaeria miniovina]|uniref:P-loop containing nucleoside triphosphate hydrolase protein n=1 Tax=Lasiosphaeria miniovina TaxID=1954250 RepID=A0AA40ACL1_9PEZI|nr:P-loop containing nucleoside triphosphate hydrolase protein [Lasiosphaeria miniovina]KAK0713351.1 P-loop containing nucleoside triphosphate hydrolase protein [Lasiosphaeria miniovina]